MGARNKGKTQGRGWEARDREVKNDKNNTKNNRLAKRQNDRSWGSVIIKIIIIR